MPGNERAISGGTSWGDDGANLRLVTQELEPRVNAQNQVIGFEAVGGNDSGRVEHLHGVQPLLHAVALGAL